MKAIKLTYLKFIFPAFFLLVSNHVLAGSVHQFRTGDNLISILKSHGFNERQRKVALSQPGIKDLIFQTNARYYFENIDQKKELRFYHPTQKKAFRVTKNKGVVSVSAYAPQFKVQKMNLAGTVHYSLQEEIERKTNSQWVSSRFLDAYKIDNKEFRKLPKGTKYSLTVEKLYEGSFFIRFGEVLNTDLVMNGRSYPKKFVPVQGGGFFISTKYKKKDQALYAPVNYIRISSTFKPNRRHPVTKRIQAHLGVDFELPIGSPVYASQRGIILRKGYQRAAGNFIVIRHPNGLETYYNHLQRIESKIRPGHRVKSGEKIGTIGCTGYCTQPHLHFAVKKKGKMVNPLPFLRPYHAESERFLAKQGYVQPKI